MNERPNPAPIFIATAFSTLEYAIDLAASVVMLLASYRVNSWCLWGIGLGALVLTIVAKNVAAWTATKEDKQ